MIDLLLFFLVSVSVFSLGCGLWIGYRDLTSTRPSEGAASTPPDEDVMIFDRVTEGLAQLPSLNDPGALWAAQKDVKQRVGEQYGLKSAEVGIIYWRVWHWKNRSTR